MKILHLKQKHYFKKNVYLCIKKVTSNPDFVPSSMKAINLAAKSLCEWVHAVNNFTDIYREITIKKDNCKAMDLEL